MALRKKKLGERIGAGLVQLKGSDDTPQVFSIISDNILSYDYHYDDLYNQLGRFMCQSEYDDNGKILKKAACCKMFKKRQDRVLIPVIHYEGSKKSYRKIADGKVKYLSITSYKYNQLCKELDDAGVTFEDCDVDILLKSEDAARGKISFEVLTNDSALWKEDDDMQKLVTDALETYEEDIMASLPVEYTEEEFNRLIKEAEENAEAPDGVEYPYKKDEVNIPKKKKEKSKAKVEKDLDDDLDEADIDDEDETPKKKKKKSVKEQIEEEDYDNEDLDEEDSLEEDEDEDLEEEETPKKKKKKKVVEEDEDEDEDDEEDEDEKPRKKKKKIDLEEDEDEDE